ncbi:uncharacterized abhydrolase domain-containing protein DDB_G0269086-like [Sorghum bicolor]|uniref:uncharacterized abhydrolase domain-containing protein DDB_G0269086-like n=1 Tax=Sorghum bicolor TaxID=4558 RepID=UPI000B4269E2|nr:uncharacterized abhydrolase domain-containing protein DDB_G0269086-like [Sorghum bicolor]|eukprot:XP_021317600.1 uncharacterized abhydrolase domain-containing protein DDB_G0269086-like [Sorghum bicolor]
MRAWFYVRTPAASKTLDDGSVDKVYPYASLMKELKPFSKVDPSQEMSEERLACDKAFALACRYSGGRDLVEEMVAADYWPLGRRTDEFTIEMVQVPVFGPPEGLPFPRFGAGIPEDETKESFLDRVEVSARRIVGKISEKEYLQRRSALGTMPRFNRIFEELGIEYEDYVIPPDVLLGLEKKKDSSKAVALAESKKRKGGGAVKQLAKKRRAEVVVETPVESSSARSSGAESNSVASAPAGAAAAGGAPEVEASRAVSSVRAPFASLLGEESSDAEAPEPSPAREANPAASEGPRVASVGGGSPPKEVQVESSDEAESASVRRIRRAEAPLRPAGDADVFAGLATAEEMAKGASVAQEGLAVPPPREPAPSALANRPSPADVLGPGASEPSITGWTDALREVHSLVGDRFRQKLRGMDFDTLLRVQYEHHSLGHHMAAALEERCSREVICRDEAIGALKKENETLEAEKARLSEEVKEFSSVRREVDSLRKERDDYKAGSAVLKKEKEDAEASAAVLRTSIAEAGRVRDLALQRAEKAEDIAERLRRELDAERTLGEAPLLLRPAAMLGLPSHG